ncbi:efflux RND transporter periplasmic adaptor subunit [Roseibium algae]|uniref:Efflux RND transporter periplasmic adaptor subunit n=1 Tax=Roseibium algae TaxID=3123038 RepID=A0ABU8TLM6_9HYPH
MSMMLRSLLLVPVLMLAACNEETVAPKEIPRPVLSIIAMPSVPQENEFTGTIEPRYTADLGFQVFGRIISRNVDIGDRVSKGELIALLDPKIYEFAVNEAKASLSSAQAQLTNAKASELRFKALSKSGVSSASELDAAKQANETAEAGVSNAKAALQKAEEQLGYTKLKASFDGVVTAVEAQVGQVADAGDTIMTVARLDQRDAIVDIPESLVGRLRNASFVVTLQAFDAPPVNAKVREVSPEADSVTRTRRIRMTLDNPPDSYRLGSIISARSLDHQEAVMSLPLSALLEEDGKSFVWVVDEEHKTVRKQQISIGQKTKDEFIVLEGVESGMRIVTAGVHALMQDQEVSIGEEKRS